MITYKRILLPISILLLALVITGVLMVTKPQPEEKVAKPPIPVVKVIPVELDDVQLKVQSQGVFNPRYETRLVAQVSGQIVSLSDQFVRGGFVTQGQVLARIDPSDYESALIEAQANLASALAALEIEQAAGYVAEEEWKNISSAQPSALGLRRPQLKQEQARVKAATAMVKRAKRNLERTQIIAPFDALIEARQIGMGSYVGIGTEIGKLYNTSVGEVRLPIPTDQLQYLEALGVNADVDLHSNFLGQPITWQAKIARSEGVIDQQTRMSYLVAEVKLPYHTESHLHPLRFGTYLTAEIHGMVLPNAITVGQHLVRHGKIATLDPQNKLKFKSVVVSRQQNREAVITAGLNEGERLIISALDYPVDGMDLAMQSSQIDVSSQDQQTSLVMQE